MREKQISKQSKRKALPMEAHAPAKKAKVKVVDVKLSGQIARKPDTKKLHQDNTIPRSLVKDKRQKIITLERGKEIHKPTNENIMLGNQIPVMPPLDLLKSFKNTAKLKRLLAPKRSGKESGGRGFLAKPVPNTKRFSLDLRIHSPASLGYFSVVGVDPAPALVRLASAKGLDVIAITDYYSASYVDLIKKAAENSKVAVIPGLDLRCEISSCKDVYIIVLFPERTSTNDIERILEQLKVPKAVLGDRHYCLELRFKEALRIIEDNGGLVIPSRIDKTPYRQLAIPALVNEFGFRTFDLVYPDNTEFFKERWPNGGFTFFSFSNANALAQIGSRMATVKLSAPSFAAIKEIVSRRLSD